MANAEMLDRAQGSLFGQLAGDSLGSLVEFQPPARIGRLYPDGVRDLADGGTWNLLAGQPTDDSELALTLARTLVRDGTFDAEAVFDSYRRWLSSSPFDVGAATVAGLRGQPDPESQSNGALMRVSPLGIFGARHSSEQVAEWAAADAGLTHPNPVCRQVSSLYARAVALAVREGPTSSELYRTIVDWSQDTSPDVRREVRSAELSPPAEYMQNQGWVLTALRNALWQLLNAPNPEEGIVDTVMRGGDTDTNAAIAGALLGAVHGFDALPKRWTQAILACRPSPDNPKAANPRPQEYWPNDALELAERLLG